LFFVPGLIGLEVLYQLILKNRSGISPSQAKKGHALQHPFRKTTYEFTSDKPDVIINKIALVITAATTIKGIMSSTSIIL